MLARFRFHPHRYARWYLAIGVVAVLGLLTAVPALAQATAPAPKDDFTQKLYQLLSQIVLVLVQAVANLTALMTHVLIVVSSYNEFINVPVVRTGWALIRDITNMFFIIGLLIIAAGTILRIENYRYNRLLARVVIMAFLVNYSRLIAGFLIQTSQVVMLTFVNSYKEALFGNFASMFGLDAVLKFANQGQNTLQDKTLDFGVILMSLVVGLGLMIAALVVTITMVIMLVVRIVALWILVILSPIAYAMRILPNTERYAQKWWSEFGKYVTTGPILAFFLWLALALVVSTGANTLGNISSKAGDYKADLPVSIDQPFANEILSLEKLTAFTVAIIFLVMAMKYASDSGTVGAKLAAKVGTGVGLTATGVRALQDRTVRPLQSWYKARQDRAKTEVGRRGAALLARTDKVESATIGRVGRGIGAVTQGVQAGTRAAGRQAGAAAGAVAAGGVRLAGRGAAAVGQRVAPLVQGVGQQLGGAAAGAAQRIGAQPQVQAAAQAAQRVSQQAQAAAQAIAASPIGRVVGGAVQRTGQAVGEVGRAVAGGATAGYIVGTRGERVRGKSVGEYEEREVADTETLARAETASIDEARSIALNHSDQRTRYAYARRMARKGELKKQFYKDDAPVAEKQVKDRINNENRQLKTLLARKDVELSDTGDELDKRTNGYDPDVRQDMFEGTIGDRLAEGKRQLMATVGAISEAFSKMDIAGKVKLDIDAANDYISRNMNRVVDNVKKGIVSLQTVSSQTLGKNGEGDTMLEAIHKLGRLDDETIIDGTKDKNWGDAYVDSMAKIVERNRGRHADTDDLDTETGRNDEKLRRSMSLGGRGGSIKWNDAQGTRHDENVLDVAYRGATGQDGDARTENLRRLVRTEGRNFTRARFHEVLDNGTVVDMTNQIQDIVTRNINVSAMAAIFEKVPATVEEVLRRLRALGQAGDLSAIQKINSAARNDILAGLQPPFARGAGGRGGRGGGAGGPGGGGGAGGGPGTGGAGGGPGGAGAGGPSGGGTGGGGTGGAGGGSGGTGGGRGGPGGGGPAGGGRRRRGGQSNQSGSAASQNQPGSPTANPEMTFWEREAQRAREESARREEDFQRRQRDRDARQNPPTNPAS